MIASVLDVSDWLAQGSIRRLTISGGEPMDQAGALVELLTSIRREGQWLVTCYSGYPIERLRQDVRPHTAALIVQTPHR